MTVKGVGPAATNDTGSVNEDATLSVNSGSGVTSNDTGGDTESLEVTNIRTGTESGSGTSGSVGTALTGTYGELTINADGSYTMLLTKMLLMPLILVKLQLIRLPTPLKMMIIKMLILVRLSLPLLVSMMILLQ